MSKFQLSTYNRFGVIRKKVKTWTHLPEKPLSKNKETRRARDVPMKLCSAPLKCERGLTRLPYSTCKRLGVQILGGQV